MNTKLLTAILIVAAIVGGVLYFSHEKPVSIQGTNLSLSIPDDRFQHHYFFATSTTDTTYATTTSATSTTMTSFTDTNGRVDNGYFVVAGAERVTFKFKRTGANGNAGSSAFNVDATTDGTTWFDFANMVSATSSATAKYDYYTISGTTTDYLSMDLTDEAIYAVRCAVVETTDGEHYCEATASW